MCNLQWCYTQSPLLSAKQIRVILLCLSLHLLIKIHIWTSRKRGVTPNLSTFKEIVKARFITEKYIASYEKQRRTLL